MVAGAKKIKSIANIICNGIAINVLTFRDEFIMNFTPQFMPNTYPGLGMLEKSKWRRLTFTLDSDSDIFDFGFSVVAANSALGMIGALPYGTGSAEFTLGETLEGDGSGATGIVVGWTLTGGDWGGTAAGVVYLSNMLGTPFDAVEVITGSISGVADTTAIETYVFAALPYDTGKVEFTVGETLDGDISGASGTVVYWTVTSGTWALDTAAGVVYISTVTDPSFQAEAVDGTSGGDDMITATGPEVAVFAVTFIVADETGTAETWTYTATSSYVQRKEFGRTEDGARRNTTEYTIIMFGQRSIT